MLEDDIKQFKRVVVQENFSHRLAKEEMEQVETNAADLNSIVRIEAPALEFKDVRMCCHVSCQFLAD